MVRKSPFFLVLTIVAAAALLAPACNSVFTPKPKGYFKIDLPEHKYLVFSEPGFPYTFEYPAYAKMVQDSTYFDYVPENPYWRNIDFPQFDCKIFLSYKQVGGRAVFRKPLPNGGFKDSVGANIFDKMVADAFKLTYKNEVAATKIDDSLMQTPNGVHGVFFKVKGNAATGRQFFLSDTLRHFLRGALYFHATPNADSLAPVQDFLEQDMKHLINTFRWVKQ
jgi:gliding motility-associated lipoprotein GldD